ncbi:hypothetical protein JCM3770_006901 [Rhodotorula araucariae]
MATAPDDAMCIPGLVDDLPEDELDRLFPRAGILPASPRIQSGPVLVVKAWSRIRSALRKKRHDASAGPTGYQDSVIFLEMLSLLLIMKLCKEHGEHSMYPGHTDWAEVNWLPLQRELDTEDDRHHMEVHTLGKPHSRYVAQDRRVLERS